MHDGPNEEKKSANSCNWVSFDAGALVCKGMSFTNAKAPIL